MGLDSNNVRILLRGGDPAVCADRATQSQEEAGEVLLQIPLRKDFHSSENLPHLNWAQCGGGSIGFGELGVGGGREYVGDYISHCPSRGCCCFWMVGGGGGGERRANRLSVPIVSLQV